MKILHVLNHSLPQTDGYAIRSDSIIRAQRAMGWEPLVVTSPQHGATPEAGAETVDGVRYYRTAARTTITVPFLRQFQMVRKMTARIREVARLEQPDLVHAHSPCLWGEAAGRAARRLGIPFVYEIRGLWEDAAVDQGKTREGSLRYRLSRALETRVARAAGAVVVIAEQLKEELLRRGIEARKLFVVPNGVDVDKFQPIGRDEQLASAMKLNGAVCVGYIGSLYPWEGVEDLVRAAPQIVARAPATRFLIVGGGPQEKAIRRIIGELGVGDRVQFVGNVSHKDILRYYSVLDILVYPRRQTRNTEFVTPLKPLEAMALGKAVLASDVGGLRELLPEETGVLYPAGDTAALAAKCLTLIAHPEERTLLGIKARALVLATHEWKTVASRYRAVYSMAFPRRGRPDCHRE
jgi:PEP-CTERM/exosortase A-associated glycosyltransferase